MQVCNVTIHKHKGPCEGPNPQVILEGQELESVWRGGGPRDQLFWAISDLRAHLPLYSRLGSHPELLLLAPHLTRMVVSLPWLLSLCIFAASASTDTAHSLRVPVCNLEKGHLIGPAYHVVLGRL